MNNYFKSSPHGARATPSKDEKLFSEMMLELAERSCLMQKVSTLHIAGLIEIKIS